MVSLRVEGSVTVGIVQLEDPNGAGSYVPSKISLPMGFREDDVGLMVIFIDKAVLSDLDFLNDIPTAPLPMRDETIDMKPYMFGVQYIDRIPSSIDRIRCFVIGNTGGSRHLTGEPHEFRGPVVIDRELQSFQC